MDQHSIAEDLLFFVVAETKADELTVFERLYVAENAGFVSHEGWHADLYIKCGCLEEAFQYYKAQNHIRKLGDLCWARGDLDSAHQYYSVPGSRNGHSSRFDKDWDRLIKLSFFQSDWSGVVRFFLEAPISSSTLQKRRVVLGNSEVSGTPYMKMLAVALSKNTAPVPADLHDLVTQVFQLQREEWENLCSASADMSDAQIKKLQKRSLPLPALRPAISLSRAFAKGDTPRSQSVLRFLGEAGTHLGRARRDVKAFLRTGEEEHLRGFLDTVLLSGVASISHSILFRCLELDGSNLPIAPLDRLIRLYGCHPVMNKRYFGRLLEAKFELKMSLCADDILTGMFQKIGSITSAIESIHGTQIDPILDYPKLASCREWAVMRLQHWLDEEGAYKSEKVAETWRNRTFQKVSGPFHGDKRNPESPRCMAEWAGLIDDAFEWLGEKWNNEIGISPWISENKLFQLMRQAFKPSEVFQHAQPVWLAPQHLDVFIPDLSLAVEYMGRQHYEPIDYFGGEEGLRQTIERDQRKGCMCKQLGIQIIYIRHDEDVSERVGQIRAMYPDSP